MAGSVMHNVAEGFDGGSSAEFAKVFRYAKRPSRYKAAFQLFCRWISVPNLYF